MRATKIFAIACLFVFAVATPLSARAKSRQWHSGRVVSASISGYGYGATSTRARSGRKNVWWTYCITGGGKTYSAVSRTNPSKAGLTVDSPIRYSADKDRVYILNSRGARYMLRRLSLDDEKTCR